MRLLRWMPLWVCVMVLCVRWTQAALRRTDEFAETFEKVRLDSIASTLLCRRCTYYQCNCRLPVAAGVAALGDSASHHGSVSAPQFAAEKCAPFKGVQPDGDQPLECMAVRRSGPTVCWLRRATSHAVDRWMLAGLQGISGVV